MKVICAPYVHSILCLIKANLYYHDLVKFKLINKFICINSVIYPVVFLKLSGL